MDSGTNRSVALLAVAARAREIGAPLDTYYSWTREWMTFPNGAHVVEIEIDQETGRVTLERYTAVDDYGVLINPMIAAGQTHAGFCMQIEAGVELRSCLQLAVVREARCNSPSAPKADTDERAASALLHRAVTHTEHLARVSLGG